MKQRPPDFWVRLLYELGGVDRKLAGELWGRLYPTERTQLLFTMNRVTDSGMHPATITHLAQALSPALLMELCLHVAPENGQVRRADVRRLEEQILSRSKNGAWT